jgi:tRNA-dihydrouridine synthase
VPLIGNGSVDSLAAAQDLLAVAPCAGLMIGTAAIADPWIFNGLRGMPAPSKQAAKQFLLTYANNCRSSPQQFPRLGPLKQCLKYWRSADLFDDDEATRQQLLRSQWPEIAAWLTVDSQDMDGLVEMVE